MSGGDANSWDSAYARERPPWDIGRPQQALARIAEQGGFHGRLLDSGCGTGELTMLAASLGVDATGVDVSTLAIEMARGKAAERGSAARFLVGDALELPRLVQGPFDVVVDSGLFHSFRGSDRDRYVGNLAAVTGDGSVVYVMCFSDLTPGDWGPPRIRREELLDAFRDGWTVEDLRPDVFEINPGFEVPQAHAWLGTFRRVAASG